jgi:hypothetical protein
MKNEIIKALGSDANAQQFKIGILLDQISDCLADVTVIVNGERREPKGPSEVLEKTGVFQRKHNEIAEEIVMHIDDLDPVKIISELETWHRFCLERLGALREDWVGRDWEEYKREMFNE